MSDDDATDDDASVALHDEMANMAKLDVSRSHLMITVTSVEAQSRFGELIDRSQREPVAITRRGRTVAYVVSEHEMRALELARRRSQNRPARKVSELLAMPVSDDGEFDVPRSRELPRPADLS